MTLLIVCGIGTPNGFGTEGGIQKLHGQNIANFEKQTKIFRPPPSPHFVHVIIE